MLWLLALASVASATLLPDIKLSPEALEYVGDHAKAPASASVCLDINFRYCQVRFNEVVGIDDSLDWTKADQIREALHSMLDSNLTTALKVCTARAQMYQCLGAQYYSCVSLYNLIPKGDRNEVYAYVSLMNSLNFICTAGFQETVNQYDCLKTVDQTDKFKQCQENFAREIQEDPNGLCRHVNRAGFCFNEAYSSECVKDSAGAGWYGCERFRVAFDESCFDMDRCFVHA